jgi:hypothetical protein
MAILLRLLLESFDLKQRSAWHNVVAVASWMFSPTILGDLILRGLRFKFSSFVTFWAWAFTLALVNGVWYALVYDWIRIEAKPSNLSAWELCNRAED